VNYLIQGTNGGLKYWVVKTVYQDMPHYHWTGLIDNADWFTKQEAEEIAEIMRKRSKILVEVKPV
jgi:hypothetical protein